MSDLRSKVVVVTGASSGIGREAAIEFARRGATVVLAARREEALEETARACREAGGAALVAVTDVSREADVQRLVEVALSASGRIDVWVNNAGVTLFAPLETAPFEEHRRVIETNLFGAMFAARALIPIFRQQKRGTLINVGSILSKIGQPFVPSYAISKFALRGVTEVLRVELADQPEVHICSIFPYAIDTPHFQEGANHMGRGARAMPPVQSPEKVALAIVGLAERPRREVHVPKIAVLGLALHALMPRTVERMLLEALREWHFDGQPERSTQGNLFERSADGKGEVHGERRPQLSTFALVAWLGKQLVRGRLGPQHATP